MSFAGDLKNINLGDVFQNIHTNSLTGALILERKEETAYLLFQEGSLAAFAYGDEERRSSFADILARQHVLDEETIDEALDNKGRRELRTYLDDHEILDEDAQREAYRFHVEESTYEIFTWTDAHFRFEEGSPPTGVFEREAIHLKLSIPPTSILMEAARRSDEWERIRRKIPSFKEVYVPDRPLEDADREVSEVESDVVDLLDGRRDLEAVIEALPHGRFAVAQAVADLLSDRCVKPVEAGELVERATEMENDGDLDQAARFLERALELERGSVEARRRLAEVREQCGEKGEAAEQWKKLGYLLAERGKTAEALEVYRKASDLAPGDIGLHETLFRMLCEEGRDDEAIEAGTSLAGAALDQHLYDRAIAVYEELLELGKRRTDLRRLLAEAHLKKPDVEAALDVYRAEARDLLKEGDLDGAASFYRDILELEPDDQEATSRVAEIESGLWAEKRKRRRRLIKFLLAVLLLAGLGTQAVREVLAARALWDAYPEAVRAIDRPRTTSVSGVAEVLVTYRETWPWTVHSLHAGGLLDRLVRHEVDKARAIVEGEGVAEERVATVRRRLESLLPFLEESSDLHDLVTTSIEDLPTASAGEDEPAADAPDGSDEAEG